MSNNTSSSSSSAGVGFAGLLTVAFIVLKLLNVIHWSWVWVVSPLWISAFLVVSIFAAFIIGAVFFGKKKIKTK